ncbi:MAG TPA: heme-binding protein [Bacteroidota bacterium]|jgi:uncharacterized protein GlcG (DUF336 family)|nr:heme-binding protein [Bacteroidota bacterium]
MNRSAPITLLLVLQTCFTILSCDPVDTPVNPLSVATDSLSQAEVKTIVGQAVQQAQRLSRNVTIVVVDREGNTLAVYLMTGAADSTGSATRKARTAAYLSSNGHAFTTLTACFITRDHFPPGILNTPAGPLFGVGFSSLPGGDVQPNPGPLNDEPGGVPLYKRGVLVGGIGVSGSGSGGFVKDYCGGVTDDEVIALGAVFGFQVPDEKRGDNIFIDGIRFLYANAATPRGNYADPFDELIRGAYTTGPVAGSGPKFPVGGGFVLNIAPGFDFPAKPGSILPQTDVEKIIRQAAEQAAVTRAAIRRPVGAAAQVFISVVDVDGSILGIWRTPDATIFSFDVSAQKARTALAFSNLTNVEFGKRIRLILDIDPGAPLSITTRAIGFLSQRFYPPGIDRDSLDGPVEHGPLFEEDADAFGYQRRLLSEPGLPAYGNGITIFPGGIALYKNGRLAGAIGVSGDGVDQDDLIAAAGTVGFEPAQEDRCDNILYHGVRLPYVKFPRRSGL